MPQRTPSLDRGYLDLPSAYYVESPRRATFASGVYDATSTKVPDSPIKKAWNTLHERRKSKAELEEDMWFGGLVDVAEQERKRKEGVAVVLAVILVLAMAWGWWRGFS